MTAFMSHCVSFLSWWHIFHVHMYFSYPFRTYQCCNTGQRSKTIKCHLGAYQLQKRLGKSLWKTVKNIFLLITPILTLKVFFLFSVRTWDGLCVRKPVSFCSVFSRHNAYSRVWLLNTCASFCHLLLISILCESNFYFGRSIGFSCSRT